VNAAASRRGENSVGQLFRLAGLLLIALLAYLFLWPVPIQPLAWQAPAFDGYSKPHDVNNRLAALELVSIAPEVGPEHIDFGPDGRLYTGVLSGAILRMNPDGTGIETVADTGGRPLGFDFAADGTLIVADAVKGLLHVATDGVVTVLSNEIDGDPIRYADAVVIADDGLIYFTDATRRFSPANLGTFDASVLDILEHSCTGRVLVYDPQSARTSLLISGLCFPNGVALSGDGRSLFIAETGEYRIWRVDAATRGLDGPLALASGDARAQLIASNLPGFPDNLTRSVDGHLWTGLTKPRSKAIDGMASKPWLRAVTARLPKSLWPVPPAYGHVIAFDEAGHVVADLQDPAGRLEETSGVTEHGGRLFVHSLHAQAFGVLDMGATGLSGPAVSPEDLGALQGHRQ
jgi:sugar lactone lactonase YvrE